MIYKHTQTGWMILAPLLVAALGMLAIVYFGKDPIANLVIYIVLAILVVAGFLFSSLTVMVDRDTIAWHFGPGFWKKTIARSDIASIEQIKTKWWWGYGIRMTPKGWMYNVAGNQAVALNLKTGKTVLIGADEPDKLARALGA